MSHYNEWYTLFFMQQYPMKWLDHFVREELANALDGHEANFPRLATGLSYTQPEIDNIRARTRHMPEFCGSLMMSLLHHYDNVKEGTIQELQMALMRMNHHACSIIPDNMASIKRSAERLSRQGQNAQNTQSSRRGETNTESSECSCSGCINRSTHNQMNTGSPGFQRSQRFPGNLSNSFFGYPEPMSDGYSPVRHDPRQQPVQRSQMSESVEIPILRLESLQEPESAAARPSCSGRSSPNHDQPALAPVQQTLQAVSSQSCSCERCRLSSDPDETLLLKTDNSTRMKCSQGDSTKKHMKTVYERKSWSGESDSQTSVMRFSISDSSTLNMKGETSKEKPAVMTGQVGMQIYKFNVRSPSEPSITFENNFDSPPSSLDHHTNIAVQNITGNVSRSTNVESRERTSSSSERRAQEVGSRKQSSVPRGINPVYEPFGFVTYMCETPYRRQDWHHMQNVLGLCETISNAGIKIYLDMDSTCMNSLKLNRLDWLDKMIREAKFIIVCISRMYHEAIQETEGVPQARASADDLNARYIYDQLRTEFRNNHAKNHRLIPVIFPEANRNHIPAFMGSTLIYSYPQIKDKIAGIIRDHYL